MSDQPPTKVVEFPLGGAAYERSVRRRVEHIKELAGHPELQQVELAICRRDPLYWFDWWAWTYDPRNAPGPTHLPFDTWKRQRELLQFISARQAANEDGLIEKSRDQGGTYLCGGHALHQWLFTPGYKATFGSRKLEYVDRLGNPDTIFEKLRIMLRVLPPWMKPKGFVHGEHDLYLRFVNPELGNTIVGEGGDEIGRGGRSKVLFLDESAYLEHGDTVDAATAASADCRIFLSTVKGMGNMFARKRHGGALRPDQIFTLHYRDDEHRPQEYYERKRRSMEPHKWAEEYEIDYSASVEGVCIPGIWVQSSIELRRRIEADPALRAKLKAEPSVVGRAGLDVGAGGKGKSVFIARFGPFVDCPESWGHPDTTKTALDALQRADTVRRKRSDGTECRIKHLLFDSPGVGAGVMSTLLNHGKKHIQVHGVNTGLPPTDARWPDGETSEEKFANLKAERWWQLRTRFKATHELLLAIDGKENGEIHPISDCILLPSLTEGPDAQILASQLSLPKVGLNEKGKIIMETKAQMRTRELPSPDHADALVLTEGDPDPKPMVISDAAVTLFARPRHSR